MRYCYAVLLSVLVCSDLTYAGGPLGATGTTPRRYAATSFPLRYHTDLGTLGAFSNATAVGIAQFAVQQWDNVSSAAVSFAHGGYLARDVVSATDPYISGSTQWSDRINPIVFDANGSITDAKLGVGANRSVIGFAGSAYSGNTYVEGYAIINGALTGSGTATDLDKYRATITHEIGHLIGLGHSQVAMFATYPTMYPIVLKNEQRLLQPDDTTALANLYPTPAFQSATGTITGTVRRPSGANLSGVNVIAQEVNSGASFSTLVDYFSGGKAGFDAPPAAAGTYTLSGLRPGNYYIRIEPVNGSFTGGSALGSYNTPINTSINREWYSSPESGDMLVDNTNVHAAVSVFAGSTRSGIDVVHNESSTTSMLAYHNSTPTYVWSLPQGSITRYATRFTAPTTGSLVGVQFRLAPNSTLPLNGSVTITVHANQAGSLAGVPGSVLGSVTIPYRELAGDQFNEVYLKQLGAAVNFVAGAQFHIAISTNGVGTPILYTDNGSPTQNRTSYFNGVWQNFPQGGYAAGYNILMSALYSTTQVQVQTQTAISLSPISLDFGPVRTRTTLDKTVRVTNTGNATLSVTGTSIIGRDSVDYVIFSGGGAFTLAPGAFRDIIVRFQPCDPGGVEGPTKSASLLITSNAPTSPNAVPLVGTAVEPAALAIVAPIQFECARPGGAYLYTDRIILNAGQDSLRISDFQIISEIADTIFRIMTPVTPMVVPPDSSIRLTLCYEPKALGHDSAYLRFNHDGFPAHTMIALQGDACAGIAQAPTLFDLGSVSANPTVDSMMIIVNAGSDALVIDSVQVESTFGATEGAFFSVPLAQPLTIAAGDSLRLPVRLDPRMGVGTYDGVARLFTNSYPDSVVIIQLRATVVAAAVAEVAEIDEVHVSPNPASEYVLLSNVPEWVTSIQLIDATGRLVHVTSPTEPLRIELADVASGAYILRLHRDDRYLERALIVTH